MANRQINCPTFLRQLFRYEPSTGKLYWKQRPRWMFTSDRKQASFNTAYAGKEVCGQTDKFGYCVIRSKWTVKRAHRVIWAIQTGSWPRVIDHINGDPADNRWENLRDVSYRGNAKNMCMRSDNSSGVTGVRWAANRWVATISAEGERKHLGRFTEKADAIAARKEAERKYGYHENHGRR